MNKGRRALSRFFKGVATLAASVVILLSLAVYGVHQQPQTGFIEPYGEPALISLAENGLMGTTQAQPPSGNDRDTYQDAYAPSGGDTQPASTLPQSTAASDTAAASEPSGADAPANAAPPQDTTAPADDTSAPDDAQTTATETTAPTSGADQTTAATTVPVTTAPATTAAQTSQSAETEPVDPNIPVVNEYGIFSKAALLIDLNTGEELFSLLPDERMYPASIAKIMTAILTIEHNSDLDRKVTITDGMLKGLAEAYASTAGFAVGEAVSLRDLLYGVMLPSGADATNAVAVTTAGSVSAFVDMMNAKAAELGMSGTRFANTHGLHDKNQYSTARDLATLLRYALQSPSFRAIFTTATHTTAATEQHPDGILLKNNLAVALREHTLSGGAILGNKTGFTTPAGQCLASLATVNGREYILVTLGAGKTGYNTQRYNMLDALTLYGRISR